MTSDRPRRQQARTEATRLALLDAAREQFVARGHAGASTPAIVEAAAVTRGALYHHFADKRALFHAVLAREAKAVADDIAHATPAALAPRAALEAGSRAYLASMATPGRTRLLLVEGPAVLGHEAVAALDAAHAARALREGLAAALVGMPGDTLDAIASLLSAAFDRAALDIEAGAREDVVHAAIAWMLGRLLPG
ncbi:TetR/AcrR family transcriptional regulator [Marilutibacter aestuarii]|uniref:TetR/AcrR family transcriptional regulator n=1 Tax=Marilutibacter aestuarii TaxID=1706195 RepID=A0A508A6I1_9GAMM|nr:TetR/AcrR family transcriptional regulator [Lysobacter aestuarii]TQD43478.1 TetR/AcrR family transcriptional regulator [Lysobacter aestuarii]